MLLLMLIGWLPWLLFGGAIVFLGLRAVRAVEHRGAATNELLSIQQRLQLLEDTVAEQGEAVRRISDGQEFTQRLLLERARVEGGPAASEPAS